MKDQTIIFCDGSSLGNPGAGGWGTIIKYQKAGKSFVKEIGGNEKRTTNNRMELKAAIEALRFISEVDNISPVIVHTDSQYVINGITKWVFAWERRGWITSTKEAVLNRDLWEELMELNQGLNTDWQHVSGHVGIAGNERVDEIANNFALGNEIRLYDGPASKYEIDLKVSKESLVQGEEKSKMKKTGKAYSYVSLVDGKVLVHKTWEECEKRVKGKTAKYKKVFSKSEEFELIKEWSRK